MAKHVAEPALGGLEPIGCDTDRCLGCGRRRPAEMPLEELEREARSYRGVERAAAGLRVVTDRRLAKPTPEWVADLSTETADAPLPAGWPEDTLRRLEEDAREACGCVCHAPSANCRGALSGAGPPGR